jgi:hypothetical protein
MLKASGIWVAQMVLVLTGNLALAASLRALGATVSLPARITVEGKSARIEYPAAPSEWDEWNRLRNSPQATSAPALQAGG